MTRELEESRDTVSCSICVGLFQDARVLTCSHSFCLHCLIGCQAQAGQNETTAVNCPVCRELTVPPLDDIPLLPPNAFANKVADLIRSNDAHHHNVNDTGDNVVEEDSQFFVGTLLPPPARNAPRNIEWNASTSVSIAIPWIVAGCIISFSPSLFTAAIGAAVVVLGSVGAVQLVKRHSQQLQHAYTCNSCRNKFSSVLRYRCGMCNDFTLCPKCFAEDNLAQRQHIFLKLKFQQKRELPLGPVLKPQAFGLAETFDYDNPAHGRAYIHSPDRLVRLAGIKCRFCGAMPITGLRYKCGMCRDYDLCSNCEAHSHRIHDKSHVFMVLKYKTEINVVSEPLLRAQFY